MYVIKISFRCNCICYCIGVTVHCEQLSFVKNFSGSLRSLLRHLVRLLGQESAIVKSLYVHTGQDSTQNHRYAVYPHLEWVSIP
jgi:hypothetical protein